jgi:hypothetical protein
VSSVLLALSDRIAGHGGGHATSSPTAPDHKAEH